MWESSGPVWETLELMVRGRGQEFTQVVLEDEVTEFSVAGRSRSARRRSRPSRGDTATGAASRGT